MFLRQSTSQVIRFGPCLDKDNGVTEETALTLAQADMRLSKDGAAFAQKNTTGNATHDSDGWYSTTLDTTDTATVGELILNVHQPANMLPVWMRFYVVEEAVYDALYAASAALNVGSAASVTAGVTLAAGAITNASLAGNMEIVFETDFATNYNTTRNAWVTNGTDFIGTGWNVNKTGYSLTITPPTAVQNRTEMDSNSTRLATLAGGIIEGVTTGTPTSTSTNTDLTGYLDGELVGRLIVFTGGTADGQAATILTYTATSGVVTFAALITAPAASDTFKIV